MRGQVIRMELKYCECCGGLLIRPAANSAVYCFGCFRKMAQVARAGSLPRPVGEPQHGVAGVQTCEPTRKPPKPVRMAELYACCEGSRG